MGYELWVVFTIGYGNLRHLANFLRALKSIIFGAGFWGEIARLLHLIWYWEMSGVFLLDNDYFIE